MNQATSEELMESACCLWEAVLESNRAFDCSNPILTHWNNCGAAAARLVCCGLAQSCHDAWEIANANGFDAAFDWEFVPAFIEKCLDSDCELIEEWQAAAVEIAREFTQRDDDRIATGHCDPDPDDDDDDDDDEEDLGEDWGSIGEPS